MCGSIRITRFHSLRSDSFSYCCSFGSFFLSLCIIGGTLCCFSLRILQIIVNNLFHNGLCHLSLPSINGMVAVTMLSCAIEVWSTECWSAHCLKQINNLILSYSTFFRKLWEHCRQDLVSLCYVDTAKPIFVHWGRNNDKYVWLRFHISECFTQFNVVCMEVLFIPVDLFAIIGAHV